MGAFLVPWASAFAACVLLATGVGHLAEPRRFGRRLAGHGVVGARLAAPAAALVTAAELATGAAAVVVLAGRLPARPVLAVAAVLGALFALYLRRLLASPLRPRSCGCTPWETPLTPAALLPATALCVAGAAGATWAAGPAGALAGSDPAEAVLAAAWGVTGAAIALLYPATVPQPAEGVA